MATTIAILETRIDNDPVTFEPAFRGVTVWVSDGTANYITQRGNLPLTGDLMTILNADSSQIWTDAVAGGLVATAEENAVAAMEAYMIANPNARLLLTTTPLDLKTQIDALVVALFPTATVGNQNKTKWLWNMVALVARMSVAKQQ